MVKAWCGLAVLGCGTALGSEPPRACFASIAEAVAQTRALDPSNINPSVGEGLRAEGFRLEGLRRDRLMNTRWAIVSSCDHPERPAVTVATGADTEGPALAAGEARRAVPVAAPVVRAGARVRLVGSDPHVRFETSGVAVENGGLGERVRVRILVADGTQPARVVTARVRGAEFLELEY